MNKADLLHTMKADAIPAGWSGLWYVSKLHFDKPTTGFRNKKSVAVPPGDYTFLFRLTDSTLYHQPPGEVVMDDSEHELKTHLRFVEQAHGKVLVSGLGLGCVIRGLLANPQVEHVTCLENSPDVMKLVAPYMPTDRLTIIEADALAWTATNKEHFDCGWHDLWTCRDDGQPHLDNWHSKIMINCRRTVDCQGAWAFDRRLKKVFIQFGFKWMG